MGPFNPVDPSSPVWYIYDLSFFMLNLDDVDEGVIKLLSHFISADHLSVYQLFKAEKLRDKKLHYKSIHKAFQRLVDLNLVKSIELGDDLQLSEKELARGAKYYKLSEEGLFTLYIKNRTYFPHPTIIKAIGGKSKVKLVDFSKNFLLRYKRYDFYRICLYPWIDYNTIAGCSPQFAKTINELLSDICIYMEKGLRQIFYRHYYSRLSEEWDILEGGIHAGEKDDKIPFVSLGEKIIKFEKKEKEKENKGYGKKMPFPRSELTLKQRAITDQMPEAMLEESKSFNLKPLYYRVIFSLVIGNIKEEDKKLLEKDAKFKRILDEVNAQFKNNYNTLNK